jgi:hypothetical protein
MSGESGRESPDLSFLALGTTDFLVMNINPAHSYALPPSPCARERGSRHPSTAQRRDDEVLTETLVQNLARNGAGAGSMAAMVTPEAGVVVVAALGLVLLGRLVWRVLFTQVEEERRSPYRSALRQSVPADGYRPRVYGLRRLSRHR